MPQLPSGRRGYLGKGLRWLSGSTVSKAECERKGERLLIASRWRYDLWWMKVVTVRLMGGWK